MQGLSALHNIFTVSLQNLDHNILSWEKEPLFSVADPGCFSRIRIFPSRITGQKYSGSRILIPDPDFLPSRMPNPDPGPQHYHPRPSGCSSCRDSAPYTNIIPDPDPYQSIKVFLTIKTVSKLLGKWSGMFIPDPDFFPRPSGCSSCRDEDQHIHCRSTDLGSFKILSWEKGTTLQCCGSGMFIPDPNFPSRIQVSNITDPGSGSASKY